MALMIPDSPFYNVTGSLAEIKIFESLKNNLPSDWVVIHSFRWVKKENKIGGKAQGEGDFIIFHPGHGILVFEVKGGEIHYQNRTWSTIDALGIEYKIQDPERQASDTKFEIIRRLSDKGAQRCLVCHAVWFPDSKIDVKALPANLDPAIVLDVNNLASPQKRIEEVFDYWQCRLGIPKKRLTQTEIRKITNFLNPEFRLIKNLKSRCDDTHILYVRLKAEQAYFLEVLDECQTVHVVGRAGTGKTVLALEKAIRDQQKGKKVLFLCFNNELANHLRLSADSVSNISSIHGFALNYMELYHSHRVMGFRDAPNFDYLMNEFVEVITNAKERFDTIIIDEAQDFKPEWITGIYYLLNEPGNFFVFYDPYQQLYSSKSDFDDSYLKIGFPIILKRNLRNTDQISQACLNIISQPKENEYFNGILGPEPEIILENSLINIEAQVTSVLNKLKFIDGIDEDQVSVVTLDTERTSAVSPRLQEKLPEFKTVRKFKGLENDVVVIVDVNLSHLVDPVRQRLFYVALSRARVLAVIILHIDSKYKEYILRLWKCSESELPDKIKKYIKEGL